MNLTILLVDDDRAVRTSVARVLESANYQVLQAADGIEAIEAAERNRVDLVLLDLNMPRRNGWKTLQDLRENDPLLPVIIITACPVRIQDWPKENGASTLMEKPLDFTKLLQTIRELLKGSFDARLPAESREFKSMQRTISKRRAKH